RDGPVDVSSGSRVYVNGERAGLSSADRAMLIVPLKEGRNVVRVITMPNRVALALIALVGPVWFVWLGWLALRRGREILVRVWPSPRLESCGVGPEYTPTEPTSSHRAAA